MSQPVVAVPDYLLVSAANYLWIELRRQRKTIVSLPRRLRQNHRLPYAVIDKDARSARYKTGYVPTPMPRRSRGRFSPLSPDTRSYTNVPVFRKKREVAAEVVSPPIQSPLLGPLSSSAAFEESSYRRRTDLPSWWRMRMWMRLQVVRTRGESVFAEKGDFLAESDASWLWSAFKDFWIRVLRWQQPEIVEIVVSPEPWHPLLPPRELSLKSIASILQGTVHPYIALTLVLPLDATLIGLELSCVDVSNTRFLDNVTFTVPQISPKKVLFIEGVPLVLSPALVADPCWSSDSGNSRIWIWDRGHKGYIAYVRSGDALQSSNDSADVFHSPLM